MDSKLLLMWSSRVVMVALVALAGCEGEEAIEAGTSCNETCPIGANRLSAKDASGSCNSDGSFSPLTGPELTGQCVGEGSCQVVCLYPQCAVSQSLVITADEFRCENTEPCAGIDCSGAGRCRNNNGQAECVCNPGYVADGLDCFDPCAGVGCSGAGRCRVEDEQPRCVCDEGYLEDGPACFREPGGCSNDIQDADEEGIDCGGLGCEPCAANAPPRAMDDEATAYVGHDVLIDVLHNDDDPDGDALALSTVGDARKGAAVIANGRIRYTPDDGVQGEDEFTYTLHDGRNGQAQATVRVTIVTNTVPTARPDDATVYPGESVTVEVLLNDSDPDGHALSIQRVSSPAHGEATINGGRNIIYTAEDDYFGVDQFNYTLSDGFGGEATSTVRVIVTQSPLVITTRALPLAEQWTAYQHQLTAESGESPYQWGLAEGAAALPEGLTLSEAGLLSGAPAVTGSFNLQVMVRDSAQGLARATLELRIFPDTVAPGEVTDLRAVYAGQQDAVRLVWTSTGDDHDAGIAHHYDLRRSREPIDASNFALATPVPVETWPAQPAGSENAALAPLLWGDGVWFFAFRAVDESGNHGPTSNSIEVDTRPVLRAVDLTRDAGSRPRGVPSEVVFSLANDGAYADLVVTSALPQGSQAFSAVEQAEDAVLRVPPGQSGDLRVVFLPDRQGLHFARLALTHNDPRAQPSPLSVSGQGTELQPTFTLPERTPMVARGEPVVLQVTIADENGVEDLSAVRVDLSALGAAADTPMMAEVLDELSARYTLAVPTNAAPLGAHLLPVTVTNAIGEELVFHLAAILHSGQVWELGQEHEYATLQAFLEADVYAPYDLVLLPVLAQELREIHLTRPLIITGQHGAQLHTLAQVPRNIFQDAFYPGVFVGTGAHLVLHGVRLKGRRDGTALLQGEAGGAGAVLMFDVLAGAPSAEVPLGWPLSLRGLHTTIYHSEFGSEYGFGVVKVDLDDGHSLSVFSSSLDFISSNARISSFRSEFNGELRVEDSVVVSGGDELILLRARGGVVTRSLLSKVEVHATTLTDSSLFNSWFGNQFEEVHRSWMAGSFTAARVTDSKIEGLGLSAHMVPGAEWSRNVFRDSVTVYVPSEEDGARRSLRDSIFLGAQVNIIGSNLEARRVNLDIDNCLFTGRTSGAAIEASGQLIFDDIQIRNTTIAHNMDGGIVTSMNMTLTDCILWGNIAGRPEHSQLDVNTALPVAVTIEHCDIDALGVEDPYGRINGGEGFAPPARGNFSEEPGFVDPELGLFSLQEGSICVDAGSMSAQEADLATSSTRRDLVLDGGAVDLGYHVDPGHPPGL